MSLMIRAGTLITASDTFCADILIEGETIKAIGVDLEPSADSTIIEAEGKLIFPGGVDPHTHFDLPMFDTVSSDDHYTGHVAAAFGGTTTVIDFVPFDDHSLERSIAHWHKKAGHKAAVDYGFHMNITRFDEGVSREIPMLPGLGITSIKVFTAYNNRLRLMDDDIFRVMRIAKENSLLTMLHAENGDVIDLLVAEALANGHTSQEWHARTRPAWGAVDAVLRAGALAAQAGNAPLYIVHMNASGEVDMLRYLQKNGVNVIGETCPQYLFFTDEVFLREDGSKWICSPPIRKKSDNQRLWKGLNDGIITVIGTDHCPFFYDGTKPIIYEGSPIAIPGKELGKKDFTKIPNGLPAVGDRLLVLWTYGVGRGLITPNQFVALNSTNPAKIFGLYPQKGALAPGSDADIVIWDPNQEITYGVEFARHRTDYNLFEGWKLKGIPEKVLLRGNVIVEDGKWLGKPGIGKYLNRRRSSLVR